MPSLVQWFSVLCAISLASSMPNPSLKQSDSVSQPSGAVAGLQTPVDASVSPVAKPSSLPDVTSLSQLSQERILQIYDAMADVNSKWPSTAKFPQRNDDPGYAVVKEVGSGGSGTIVLLAEQTSTGKLVALKCTDASSSNRELAENQLKVMMLVNTIGSSYFPRPLDHFTTDQMILPADTERNMKVSGEPLEIVCIAMDYFEGREYIDVVTRNHQPIDARIKKMLKYVLEALSALELLHYFGIVHGNIHIGNVFITSDDKVKLIDFDLATQLPVEIDEDDQARLRNPKSSHELRHDLGNLFDLTFLGRTASISGNQDETAAQVQGWLTSHPEKQTIVDAVKKMISQRRLDIAIFRSALEAILAP